MPASKDPFYHRGSDGIPATARWQDYVAVTTATGNWKDLEFWHRKTGFRACDIISGNAADAGTLAHDLIRQFLTPGSGFAFRQPRCANTVTGMPTLANEIWRPALRACASFHRLWSDANQFEPMAMESVVWSDTYGYAGRQDIFLQYNGVATMFDWKTSKDFYPNQAGELAARFYAYRECMPEPHPIRAAIVRLDKQGGDTPSLWWMDGDSGQYRKTKTDGLGFYFQWYLAHLADWRKAHPKVDGPRLWVTA